MGCSWGDTINVFCSSVNPCSTKIHLTKMSQVRLIGFSFPATVIAENMLLAGAESKHTSILVSTLLVSFIKILAIFRKEVPGKGRFIINLMVRAIHSPADEGFGI